MSGKKLLSYILILSAFLFSACGTDYSEFCSQAEEYLVTSKFQGTVLVARGKKIIYGKGFGPEDEKTKKSSENSLETVFEIGSITKQMTAAAIMQQVEKGRLDLDTSLDKFFPDYEHGSEITVRMLLNMRSGLLDHINGPDEFFGPKVARQIAKKEQAGKPVDRNQVLESFYSAPLLCKPDSTYFYSNTNYYLLALILEQVSGESYEDYLNEHIFKPAGMTTANTDFQKTTSKGYVGKKYVSIPKNLALGCGDVNCSAEDLLKWNLAFTGKKIVSKKSFEEMTSSSSYGFGVYVTDDSLLHSGVTHVFNAYNEFFLKDNISLIVISNKPVGQLNTTVTAGKLKKMLFPEPEKSENQSENKELL